MKQTGLIIVFLTCTSLSALAGALTFTIDTMELEISKSALCNDAELFSVISLSQLNAGIDKTRELLDDDGFFSLMSATQAFFKKQNLRLASSEMSIRDFSKRALRYLESNAKKYEELEKAAELEPARQALKVCIDISPLDKDFCYLQIASIKKLEQTPNQFSFLQMEIENMLESGDDLNDVQWFATIKAQIIEPYRDYFSYSTRRMESRLPPGYVIGGLGPESIHNPPHIDYILVPVFESYTLSRFTFDFGNN